MLSKREHFCFCDVAIIPDYNCFDVFKDGHILVSLEKLSSLP